MISSRYSIMIFVLIALLGYESISQERDGEPCNSVSHRLIQPFLGIWEEYEIETNGEQTFIGTLSVSLGANGCSLLQRFTSPDSTFSYTTMGFVNTGSGIWEETYIFSNGHVANYQWIIDSGDIIQRRVGGSRKIDYLHQLRFTEVTKSDYVVIQERSDDGGRTWKRTERTYIKRIGD
ncbi:hypothetical protein [Ekhidna sp.]|uniref:hypothetical protein n=1 Tax=Ekhidna sp. TaxID=2608089 RepID=UPI003B508333